MLIHHSFDHRFITTMERLRKHYGEKMFDLEGIGEQALDMCAYSKSFFAEQGAASDKTIDDNSNVDDTSVVTWEKECPKPMFKLNALYLLWKGAVDKFGIKRANKLIEAEISGAVRIMDLYKWSSSYCWAGSLSALVHNGMPFYKKIKIGTVQHFDSFLDLAMQYLCYISNQIAGACLDGAQQIQYSTGKQVYSRPIRSLFEDWSPDGSFNFAGSSWTYKHVAGLAVWEQGRFVAVKRLFRRAYTDKMYEVTTAGGCVVKCSKDHRFKVLYEGRQLEVRAEDLKQYDTVFRSGAATVDKETDDYLEGQVVGILATGGSFTFEGGVFVSVQVKEQAICDILDRYFAKLGQQAVRAVDKSDFVVTYDISALKHISAQQIDMSGRSLDFMAGYLDGFLAIAGGFKHANADLIQNVKAVLKSFYIPFKESKDEQQLYCLTLDELGQTDVVVGIREYSCEAGFVYELETESHWYAAGGIVTHNCAMPDFFVYAEYFLRKDEGELWYKDENKVKLVKQRLQAFIYSANFSWRSNQTAFLNLSVFDRSWLEALFAEHVNPDFSKPDFDNVDRLQRLFVEELVRNLKDNPFTFPVMTAAMLYDAEQSKMKDENFFKWVCDVSADTGLFNFYIDTETASLSSCCFSGDQSTLTKSRFGVCMLSFKDIYGAYKQRDFTIFHNGSWVRGKAIKIAGKDKKMFNISTKNNKSIVVTGDHIVPTLRGDLCAAALTTADYILFSTSQLHACPDKDLKLTYAQGFLIGLYAGCGAIYYQITSDVYEITYSFNAKDAWILTLLKQALADWGIAACINTNISANNVMLVKISSTDLAECIGEWLVGNYAYDKRFNLDVLLQCVEFRVGIKDGWCAANGTGSNSLYSISKDLIKTGEVLLTSLGLPSIIDISDMADEPIFINRQAHTRNYPLYCLKWYDLKNGRSLGDVYKIRNNSVFFKVKDIVELGAADDVYCFEMENQDEPYFTLPNGIITHNCRLRNNLKAAAKEYTNSFGVGGLNIGSSRVVAINLPQIAFQSEDWEQFNKNLEYKVELCHDILDLHKETMKELIAGGRQPLYTHKFMFLERQFNTVGFIGMYEALEIMGLSMLKPKGQERVKEILDKINVMNAARSQKTGWLYNVEQIPGESAAHNLAAKDRLQFQDSPYELYSNQYIPLTEEVDVDKRLTIQGLFDKDVGGGSICHINLEEKLSKEQIGKLILYAASKGVVYFAVNYNIARCANCGKTYIGKLERSPCHDAPMDNYMRVVGYLTPVKTWGKERRKEYPKRQLYKASAF